MNIQRPKKRPPKTQGLSKDDQELNKLVRKIESNKVKVMISKKLRSNLDSLDDAPDAPIDKPEKVQTVAEEKTSKMQPIDNVLAVVSHMKNMDAESPKLNFADILCNLQMVHGEVELSDAAKGSCVSFSTEPKRDPIKSENDDIARAASVEIERQTGHSLNVLVEQPPVLANVTSSGKFKWVQIATVLDSGAVRHVTPNGVFSLDVSPSQRSQEGHNYYGPSGETIPNLGSQSVKGATDSGQNLSIGFDVAKITRPLVSVSEMVRKNYKVVLDNEGSYIQNKKTGKHIEVRQEGSLYYLDLWVQVPEQISNSPFVRQAS